MRTRRGAIALLFIPIIGIILIFVMMLMNASQIALQKSMTANAADAACLGGASFVASGMQEAAWVSRKLWTVKTLVDAIYMVPFCSDANSKQYAQDLWASFTQERGPGGLYGPLPYFKAVIIGTLFEAWKLGSQASFTGYFNNLIMKGTRAASVFTSQKSLYESPFNGSASAVTWQAGDFTNTANINMGYPNFLPYTLQWDDYAKSYYFWEQQPAGWTYSCQQRGVGLNDRRVLAGMRPIDEDEPLKTVAFIKKYDVNFKELQRIPTQNELMIVQCQDPVCGINSTALPTAPVLIPRTLTLITPTMSASVNHMATGTPGGVGSFWNMRSERVSSFCTAEISGAPNLQPGSWLTPSKVSLKTAR